MAVKISNRLDKAESVFFARETEYIMTRTFDAKPSENKGLLLVPMARDLPQGITERRCTTSATASVIPSGKFAPR
jgi:hypothetical protein